MDDLRMARTSCFVTSLVMLAVIAVAKASPDATEAVTNSTSRTSLADSPNNADWHLSEATGQVVYVGDQAAKNPTIELKRASLNHLRIKVETDANSYAISSGVSSLTGTWTRSGTRTLDMTAVGGEPQLLVNGAENASLKGKWIALSLRNTDPIVSLSFPHATFVNLVIDVSQQPQPDQSSPRSELSQTNASESKPARVQSTPPPDRLSMLDAAKKAVFEVRVSTGNGAQVSKTATGWFVGDGGVIVTNFHVVNGAESLKGAFGADNTREFPLEVWAVKPEWDLALMKVKRDAIASRAVEIPPGLPIAKSDPRSGEDVWAIGFPLGMDYTVTHGTVNAVRTFDQLTSQMRSASKASKMGHGADTRWIQTDCTINSGNSGGPLVNQSGEVVGINTWMWVEGANVFFALSSTHVTALMRDIGPTPLSLAALKLQYRDVATKNRGFPTIEIPQTGKIQDAIVRALAMSSSGVCSACKGNGRVQVRVIAGYDGDGLLRTPRFEERTQDCATCFRTGYRANALRANAFSLVQAISITTPAELEDRTKVQAIVNYVMRTALANSRTFQELLGTDLAKDIGKEKLQPGTPYIGVGRFSTDFRIPGQERLKAVYMGRTNVVLSNVLINEAQKGKSVVFGGVFAGYVDSPSGDVIPVLQNGFVIGD